MDINIVFVGIGIGVAAVCLGVVYYCWRRGRVSRANREAAQKLGREVNKQEQANDVERGRGGQIEQTTPLSGGGVGVGSGSAGAGRRQTENDRGEKKKAQSYSAVASMSRKDSEGTALTSDGTGALPASTGAGLKIHTHEQVHSSSGHRREEGGVIKPASPTTKVKTFKPRAKAESPKTKGTRKPSKVAGASGDMGSVVRGLDMTRDQPETPPSEKGSFMTRPKEAHSSSPPIAGYHRPEHSPPAFHGPASYGAEMSQPRPQPYRPGRTTEPTSHSKSDARRDRKRKPASPRSPRSMSPRHRTAGPSPFGAPPPAPHDHRSDSAGVRTHTEVRKDRPRTAYSQSGSPVRGPTIPEIKPMAGLQTASVMQASEKETTYMDFTIKELRQVQHSDALRLAELLGDEFPNKMIVREAMRQLEARKKSGSGGGMALPPGGPAPYRGSSPTPAVASYAGAHDIDKARAIGAVADLSYQHGRAPQTSPAYGQAAHGYAQPTPPAYPQPSPSYGHPAPSAAPAGYHGAGAGPGPGPGPGPGAGAGVRRPVPREREPPRFKPRTSLGDRPAPPSRFPPKLSEPIPEPFKAPSRITQEYIDGYDSDESMYAPQFAKKSVRRLSVDETGVSSRDMRRAFEAVAAGDGAMRSRRRLHGGGARQIGLDKSGELSEKEFYEKYWIEAGKLGEGSFARVRKITRKMDRAPFALKVIKKAGKSREDLVALEQEIKLLSKINHKNVVNLTDWVYTKKRIYMVVEFCSGGDVFERILAEKTFSEANAAGVIRQVLEGLDHIHTRHIVHRDLKPDNLMYATKERESEVKIIDFGLAGDCSRKLLTTPCGTAHYAAPEVLSGKPYGTQADMWSLGVIVYMLLCGFPPFFDATGNTKRLYKLIKSGRYRFPSPYWDAVSDSAKDFIRGLLEKSVEARMTAAESLSHPWIGGKADVKSMSEMYLEQMQQFASSRKVLTAGAKLHEPRDGGGEPATSSSPRGAPRIFAHEEYAYTLDDETEVA